MRNFWKAALLSVASASGIGAAQAAPVTWTLTGQVTDYFNVRAGGIYAGIADLPTDAAAIGQTYTLTYTYDNASVGSCNAVSCAYNNSGETSTVTYAGRQFTVGPILLPYPGGIQQREDGWSGSDNLIADVRYDQTVANGGFAHSDLPGAKRVEISWAMESHSNILGLPPVWPDSITLDDWFFRQLVLSVTGPTSDDFFTFNDSRLAFSSFSSSITPGVPAPASLALLVIGLLGLASQAARGSRSNPGGPSSNCA